MKLTEEELGDLETEGKLAFRAVTEIRSSRLIRDVFMHFLSEGIAFTNEAIVLDAITPRLAKWSKEMSQILETAKKGNSG